MLGYGLDGIGGAGRVKPAGRREHGRKGVFIYPYRPDQGGSSKGAEQLHGLNSSRRSSSCRIASFASAALPGPAMTTISSPGGTMCLFFLKNSRVTRLMRFRTTAHPTRLLAVIPNREKPNSLVLNKKVKFRLRPIWAHSLLHRRNCLLLSNRSVLSSPKGLVRGVI